MTPFGWYWETVHLSTGEVVQSGFSREEMAVGEFLTEVTGFVLRVRPLYEATNGT